MHGKIVFYSKWKYGFSQTLINLDFDGVMTWKQNNFHMDSHFT